MDMIASYLIVTPEQFKKGWMEMKGVTPVHHSFIELGRTDEGNYVVKNPELIAGGRNWRNGTETI